jgi:hypothetical protein
MQYEYNLGWLPHDRADVNAGLTWPQTATSPTPVRVPLVKYAVKLAKPNTVLRCSATVYPEVMVLRKKLENAN